MNATPEPNRQASLPGEPSDLAPLVLNQQHLAGQLDDPRDRDRLTHAPGRPALVIHNPRDAHPQRGR